MKRIAIVPQQVTVAAPSTMLYDMLGAVDYGCRPGASLSLGVISREVGRTLVAFSSRADQVQRTIIKEMKLEPPCWVRYRHVSGPFAGACETLELRASGERTNLLLTGTFDVHEDDSAYRLRKMQVEHAAHDHLQELKHAAEERIRPLHAGNGIAGPIVQVPVLATEHDLLAAIILQEESEWGHAGHGRGVARVAVSLAEAALLPARQVEGIQRAALLHDAGKLALDGALWGKRGTLSPEQRGLMEAHPRLGYDLAARAGLPDLVLVGILHHHERWDGKGYPNGLAGEGIPLKGRILFLAEAIDSMLRANYRRPPLDAERVVAALEAGAGRQWDPTLVRKAARIIRGR